MKIDMQNWMPIIFVAAAFGCGGGHDHDHAHNHAHQAPHGGVLVNVQDEFCHIEFVREPESNRLQLHVMRFHPKEGPLKISMAQIEVSATVGGETKAIVFKPTELDGVTATTEPTSLYVAEVDWLKAAGSFEGMVKELKIEGKTIKEITFKFAKPE
jgi:hypothetical protein